MADSTFAGFGEGTYRFLRGIAKHNSKEWFEAHRTDYQECYVEPAQAFVAALGPRLQKISPNLEFAPKVNGSLFRINRDVRFSKDKSPYKTHLDLWFWEGEHRGWDSPGFFFRLFADKLILGAGMHRFEKPHLDAYRNAVVDDDLGGKLSTTLVKVKRAGSYEIGGVVRKTVPRGFDPKHKRAALLLHEGLWAGLEGTVPKEARSAAFIRHCEKHFTAMAPVNRWLASALRAEAK